MEIKVYWSVIRKRLWWMVLIAVVFCGVAGYYSLHLARPQYEASAKLLVNRNASGKQPGPMADASSISSDIMLIKTYKEIIRTPRIMEKVAEQYPDLHATAQELIAKVNVSSVNETQVMSISATDGDPERAAVMANAVSNVFRVEIRTLMNMDNVSVLNWADPKEPRQPVSPRPVRNVAIAFVLALLAGTGFAFVLDKLDDTVRTERDLREALELPVLAEIPVMKRKDRRDPGLHARHTTPAGGKPNATLDA